MQRPLQSAKADSFPDGGSQECGLSIKRLFEKMPDCCSAAPHHLAKTSSVGRSRQLPQGGSQECGLRIKRLFDEKMPDCCSVAPHHLALQGASPQGEAAKRLTIFASLCASTMRQGEGLT